MKTEFTAVLLDVKFPANCNGEFFIGRARVIADDQPAEDVRLCGGGNAAELEELTPQLNYRWYGDWSDDPKWGRQFKVKTFTIAKPHGRSGIVKYLQQARHIGEATAIQLWNLFKSDAVRITREHPELIAEKIPRLKLQQCKEASKDLRDISRFEETTIDLMEFFDGRKINRGIAKEVIRVYGNKAVELLNRNPYLLRKFRGVGFLKADSIYSELGLPLAKKKRQVLCLEHEMEGSDDTWMPEHAARQALAGKISGDKVDLPRALAIGLRAKVFSTRKACSECGGSGRSLQPDLFTGEMMEAAACRQCATGAAPTWIALRQRAEAEDQIARKAAMLLRGEPNWPNPGDIQNVSHHQRAMLAVAFRSRMGILTGGPGTGKSHSTAALIRALIAKFGIENIAAASPTNKAAVRLTECLRANDINIRATSIHSLLGVEKVDDSNTWHFKHGAGNLLPHKVILLDEIGMVGTDLGASLFNAIDPGAHVLDIGDIGQLLPINHGAILRDFIAAGIPCGQLTEPQRNAGDIVFACADIQKGIRFTESAEIDLSRKPPANFKFLPARSPAEQIEQLFKLLEWAAANGIDPVWDCQVMSAVNKTSPVSKDELNKLLQNHFQPNDSGAFRVGDKVLCDANGFREIPGSEEETFIAKGEFGKVLQVSKKEAIVKFDGENRTVRMPLFASDGCPIILAYSATVHRMQGSECKLAIPMIDESAGAKWLCSREWFYTCASRGKLLTRPIGSRSTVDRMCQKVMIGKRKTYLAELIKRYAK